MIGSSPSQHLYSIVVIVILSSYVVYVSIVIVPVINSVVNDNVTPWIFIEKET